MYINLKLQLGQWASTRRDLFSDTICHEFSHLQNHVKPHSIEHTRLIFNEEFTQSIDAAFSEFDNEPVGVGAVAQVYKAKLKKEDDYVAVKILHPNIHETIETDLKLLHIFGGFLEIFSSMKYFGIVDEIETFSDMMQKQLDLRQEAENLRRFGENFKENQNVLIPRPHERFCSRNVLVESFIEGIPLNTVLEAESTVYDTDLANIGLNAFLVFFSVV